MEQTIWQRKEELQEILMHYYQGVQIKEINEIGENILENE